MQTLKSARTLTNRYAFTAILLAAVTQAAAEESSATAPGHAAGPAPCKTFVGPDADQDCDVDLRDYHLLQACVTGPDAGPPAPGCEAWDADTDNDVDPSDAIVVANCISGPGVVADSSCEDPEYVPPTGLAKIDEELAAGLISETDALRYKVFNVFGDGRLPSRFHGITYEEGTHITHTLAEQYESLPPDVQAELTPFLLPPDAPGSWYQQSLLSASTTAAAGDEQPPGSFHELDVIDGSGASVAVVKWPTTHSLDASAEIVRAALAGPNGVYTKLTTLMGRTPLSDAKLDPELSGGDGRYDVYLLPEGSDCFGWTSPASAGFFQGVFSDRTRTSHIVMDVYRISLNHGGYGTARYNRKLRSNIAHEFMHAIQFAFDVQDSRSEYWWLGDATATWAEHYVFPNEHMEHPDAPHFLRTLDKSLEVDLPDSDPNANRRYGGYLYFFHHANKHSADILRFTYQSAEAGDTLDAIDAAVSGGISDNWAEFAVANWNDPPIGNGVTTYNTYEQSDDLEKGAKDYTEKETPSLAGPVQQVRELVLRDEGLQPLSAQYFHYDLTNEHVRSILFANGLTFDLDRGVPAILQGALGDETFYATYLSDADREHLHVKALIKQNGTWQPDAIDLTNVAFAPFCQEAASESIEEIVIIMANGRFEDGQRDPVQPQGLSSRLFISNMGCGAWEGTASYRYEVTEPDESTLSDADWQTIEYTRNTLSLAQIAAGAGQTAFGPPMAGTTIVPAGIMFGLAPPGTGYELANATATWGHLSDYQIGTTSCHENGAGTMVTSDALAGQFFIAPHLTGSLNGEVASLYRSYFVDASFVDADEASARTCVDGQGNVTNDDVPFGAGFGGGFRNSDLGSFIISTSGNQIAKTWSIDDTTFQLNLQSQKIP